MSPEIEFNARLQQIIQEFPLRVLAPGWEAFEEVWETTNRICDRYDLASCAFQSPSTNHSLRNPNWIKHWFPTAHAD